VLFDNHFVAIPAEVVYCPQTEDGHEAHLHPRPTISGRLSAITVSDGEPLLPDRDHRIKVQFPGSAAIMPATAWITPMGTTTPRPTAVPGPGCG